MDRRARLAKEKKVKQKQARAALERKAKREREADPQLADEKREEDTAKRVNELKDKMAASLEAKAQKEAEQAEAVKRTGFVPVKR
jgi:hypothetical protein|tara:strand:+ start:320 stop:574 length:255 start_codon:yes stop_codon:yes gene_type:complete